MKRILAAAAAVMLLGVSTGSFAQTVGVQVGPVGAGLNFAPEDRTRIKEYVVREKVPRTVVRERVRVGSPVPADIELRAVPSDWGPSVSRYRYYYTDSGVHFVDPANRHVIYDLD